MIADKVVQEFKAVVSEENVWPDASDLHVYACDAAVFDPVRPGLIVRPSCVEGLGRTLRLCNDHGLPLAVRRSLPAIPSN